jgi:hypothetical protein
MSGPAENVHDVIVIVAAVRRRPGSGSPEGKGN